MADNVTTDRQWPPGPHPAPPPPPPLRLAALEIARTMIGQREDPGTPNRGPIVRKVASPFLSVHRFAEQYPQGKLRWCAYFACWCFLEALIKSGDLDLGWQWMGGKGHPRLASGSTDTLWANLSAQKAPDGSSWCWTADGDGVAPQKGDLVFFGGPKPDGVLDLHHVAFVDEAHGLDLRTIGGNEGDMVAARTRRIGVDRVYGFARVGL